MVDQSARPKPPLRLELRPREPRGQGNEIVLQLMAQALGFPDVVVQGMMAICGMSDTLDANFGAGWQHGGKLDLRLVNVVWLNDVLVTDNVVLENFWERDKPIYPTGQIELQNHGNTLYFKNIFIRDLP